MSSRLLLSGTLASPATRRKRRSDGAVFAIVRIRDTDRFERREWTGFANDPEVIERLEAMRTGEPIACSGPFNIAVNAGELVYRLTVETLVDTKRRRKPKGLISRESRTESDELDLAPQHEFNDPIPFGEPMSGSDLNDALKEAQHG